MARRRGLTDESDLNLVHNTNLQKIWIGTRLGQRRDYTWICILLARMASKKIRHVCILVDISREREEAILDKIVAMFEPFEYFMIDALSIPHSFPRLKVVQFHLKVAQGYAMPEQQSFAYVLSQRLPNLCARGMLRTAVIVRDS